MTGHRKPGHTVISFELPNELVTRLTDAATDRVVGRTLLVAKAIAYYLDHLPPVDPT